MGRGHDAAWAGAALALALLPSSCALPGEHEIHLAPLVSELSLAGGDRGLEVAGGAGLARWSGDEGRLDYWALRPLVSWRREGEGRSFTWILPPLGARFERPDETVTRFIPLAFNDRDKTEEGPGAFRFFALPGIYLSRDEEGERNSALFVFWGNVKSFLSFDRAQWVLFPLFARLERNGRTNWNFLFPILQWSTGEGGRSWRLWPLYGDLRWEGRYRRQFLLWPFFTWQEEGLDRAPGEQRRTWTMWPLFGWTERGEAHGWTFLWPLFGSSADPRTGFWAWDGPWPLVVFQGGDPNRAVRRRVWPFYSYYEGDGLQSEWILWPVYNRRHEEYEEWSRDTVNLAPFWSSWDRQDRAGRRSSWRKLWPLVRASRDEANDAESIAWPALNPLGQFDFLDEHYTWLWELYSARRSFDQVRVRSFLGLYREESDSREQRRSLAGVWARRDFTEEGVQVREVSVLFGLLRLRREGDEGWGFLPPRVPGPGWPLERAR